MFPGVSAALLTRIFERKLKATELIRLKEKSVTDLDQEDRVFKMTESGGTVGFKKTASSLKDWGPPPNMDRLLPHLPGSHRIPLRRQVP
ncbi:hypothetical protein NW767_015785 [Fusarium falciforme]|nr:hypothetical protein NW767_015785 [Fusarium falciforme]